MNWRNFIESKNPVAAALLSKMGYNEKERVQVKREFLRMLLKMEINPAKAELINGFFETYLKLTESEEEELMSYTKEFTEEELDFIESLPNSWKEKGLREGRQEGLQEAKRQFVLNMIKDGSPNEKIAKLAEVDINEVEKLRRTLSK